MALISEPEALPVVFRPVSVVSQTAVADRNRAGGIEMALAMCRVSQRSKPCILFQGRGKITRWAPEKLMTRNIKLDATCSQGLPYRCLVV